MQKLVRSILATSLLLTWALRVAAEDTAALIAALDSRIPEVMEKHHVPGLSMALIRDNQIVWTGTFGVRVAGEPARVDEETVFEAASMSKPLNCYAVLKLVELGQFDLDRPLDAYLAEPYLADESAAYKITARMVMLHRTGLPNWREGSWRNGDPLHVKSEPGSRFSYSGEGFLYLQRVIEQLTQQPLDKWMEARVLRPLKMHRSSYRWQKALETNFAGGHDKNGRVKEKRRFYDQSNAAFSLYTTPTDYARFLMEIMNGERSAEHSLKVDTLRWMTTLQVEPEKDAPRSRRSLGWIVDAARDGGHVRHTGTNGAGFHCVARFKPERKSGCVIMTNNVGARSACEQILRIIDDTASPGRSAKLVSAETPSTWAPRQRTVRYEYRLLNSADEAATDMDVYVPLPLESPRQEIHYLHLPDAPPSRLFTDQHGQRLAHYKVERLKPGQWLELGYVAGITLRNMRWDPEKPLGDAAIVLTPTQRKLYLRPETNYSMDSKLMRSTAASLVEGTASDFERLVAIHDHVVNSIRYVRDNQWDTAETVLTRGTGSCSEYNYVLSGLCRLAGLPTRCTGGTTNGFRNLPTTDTVFHRWTEVFLSGYGWFPVDCSRDANPIRGKRSHFGRVYTDAMVWCQQAGGEDDTLGWDYRAHAHVRGDAGKIRQNHRVRWFTFFPETRVEEAYEWLHRNGEAIPDADLLECSLLHWQQVDIEARRRAIECLAQSGRREALRRAALMPTANKVRKNCFAELCKSCETADTYLERSKDLWAFRNWFKRHETRLTATDQGQFQLAEGTARGESATTKSSSAKIWENLVADAVDNVANRLPESAMVSIATMSPVDQTVAGLGNQRATIASTLQRAISGLPRTRVIDETRFDEWMDTHGPGSGEYWILAQENVKPPVDLSPDLIVVPVCIVERQANAALYRLDLKTLKLSECEYTTVTARVRRLDDDEDADRGHLVAGGDTMIARWQHDLVARHGYEWPLAGVADVLRSADAALCNLECCVSLRGQPADKGERCPFYYRARPEMLRCLIGAGIDIVTAANNHGGDYGPESVADTAKWCETAGLLCVGIGRNVDEAEFPRVMRVGSTLVAVAGVDATMPRFSARDDYPGTNYAPEDEPLALFSEKIDRIAHHVNGRSHLLALTIHWGPNWKNAPPATRRRMARIAFEHGVDLILGHSAHRLQGIEIIDGKPVLYDMGNLLFDCELKPEGQRSALFRLGLSAEGVHKIEIVPAHARLGRTVLARTSQANEILSEFAELCAALGTKLTVEEEIDGRPIGAIHIAEPQVTQRKAPAGESAVSPIRLGDTSKLSPASHRGSSSSVPEDAQRPASPTVLAPGVELLGYSCPTTAAEGGILRIRTWWRVTGSVGPHVMLAYQLDGPGETPRRGTPWYTRHDAGDWAVPLHRLEPGMVVEDDYPCRLAGLPPGSYQIRALAIDTSLPAEQRSLGPPQTIGEVSIEKAQ
jgi:CubicO group peptidase (beta-lactamase class C family)/poly-gamma-glutamate capsule biosynthesis protein CapA/YwtB (metallophosphatase superfamily)